MKNLNDERTERQLKMLAENRLKTGRFITLDDSARIITRKNIDGRQCLVIASGEGDTFVITPEFEVVLAHALK